MFSLFSLAQWLFHSVVFFFFLLFSDFRISFHCYRWRQQHWRHRRPIAVHFAYAFCLQIEFQCAWALSDSVTVHLCETKYVYISVHFSGARCRSIVRSLSLCLSQNPTILILSNKRIAFGQERFFKLVEHFQFTISAVSEWVKWVSGVHPIRNINCN